MTPPLRISVVVPVHNEALALEMVLAQLDETLAGCMEDAFEIIVVDDGSSDKTVDVLRNVERKVRLIRHPAKRGSGAARRTGCEQACSDLVGWIDADGTYAPADLRTLLNEIDGCEQVIGSRGKECGTLAWLRGPVKGLTSWFAGMLWKTEIPDLNSGLRLFRRAALETWLHELPDGFSCTTTATLAALNRGQRVKFCPISYRPRASGSRSKFHPVIDTFRLWRTVFRQWRRRSRQEPVHVPPTTVNR